ncbi:ATP synthase [Primorskyibacter flagellatus]|uniref:ATP synthase n=1 Tax=Primorskyibacter flagellatus TaxID=1387277 RepID=A0A917AGU3_9RHOB|nr:FliI/YscN family ATPase [Primorskyibacter flagellatus]GGE47470.1 ATP synthase [Primorskyibacter flagellatus]
MKQNAFAGLRAELGSLAPVRCIGRVATVESAVIGVTGLGGAARMGDLVRILRAGGPALGGEVILISGELVSILPDESTEGIARGDRVTLMGPAGLDPCDSWIGRVIDPFGLPLDGRPLARGDRTLPLRRSPPDPGGRGRMGARLETGMTVFNTMLPVVEGQRIGLFAGSGVGKSSLLAHFAAQMSADVVVIALVGERGRELRDFVSDALGPEGMARSVVVAATSDRSALVRRRCAWAAMTVAEHFRDQGRRVLFLADSITRFADAHREVAVAAGEQPALRGYPASTSHVVMQLCERAGPGPEGGGTITAIFTVLVAGSDMEEPVADILRGVLDGHVVLDRAIAERGRYPAIDLLRSVSRSLPGAADVSENETISAARRLLGAYDRNEVMIRAGLYSEGSDPELDRAIRAYPDLDAFLSEREAGDIENSFNRLRLILQRAGPAGRQAAPKPRAPEPAGASPRTRSGGAVALRPPGR